MLHRVARYAVFLLAVAAIAGAAYEVVQLERSHDSREAGARSFERAVEELKVSLADLGAAQRGYVAAGQGEAYWIAQVDASLESLEKRIRALESAATTQASAVALDAAAVILKDFEKLDGRARHYARSDQRLLASDTIFGEGLELTRSAAAAMDEALEFERTNLEELRAGTKRQQATLLAGAALAAIVALALLVPIRRAGTQAPRPALPASAEGSAEADVMDRLAPAPADRSAAQAAERGAPDDPSRSRAAPPVDVARLAHLCTELGRVADARELPPLLQHAAAVLDASGLIIWLADSGSKQLRPAAACGYRAAERSRLGSLPADGDSAVAIAFRGARMEIVRSGGGTETGAIVAPLLTPAGCVGVLSAETRNGRESEDAVQAVARILAAQVGTLLSPTETQTVVREQFGE